MDRAKLVFRPCFQYLASLALRLHALSGKLQGLHSVSINLLYRITLELLIQDEEIIPVNVGDHDVY